MHNAGVSFAICALSTFHSEYEEQPGIILEKKTFSTEALEDFAVLFLARLNMLKNRSTNKYTINTRKDI